MNAYHTTCPICSAHYGLNITPYVSQLQDMWQSVVWCKCHKHSFGIRLTLIEDNDSLGYKKIQLITTEKDLPVTFIHQKELPQCEVCSRQAELNEVGFYWICNNRHCIETATKWCKRDIAEHKGK